MNYDIKAFLMACGIFIGGVVLFLSLIWSILWILQWPFSHWTIARGEKVGNIVKVAQQGIFCKTWESELIRGGMNGGNGSFGTKPFYFTAKEPTLVSKLIEAMENNREVKIKYHRVALTMCASDSDNYFVDDVILINK